MKGKPAKFRQGENALTRHHAVHLHASMKEARPKRRLTPTRFGRVGEPEGMVSERVGWPTFPCNGYIGSVALFWMFVKWRQEIFGRFFWADGRLYYDEVGERGRPAGVGRRNCRRAACATGRWDALGMWNPMPGAASGRRAKHGGGLAT